MSVKVIEINDSSIKVGNETGILFRSPGFALATEDKLEVGDFAERHSRIQPTNSFNKYWHELNLDPISFGPKVRHHADLAFAQLTHLAEMADIDEDVIFSVPGNFSQKQLSILLGLAHQTSFTPIGFVNSALVDSIIAAYKQRVLHVDIQLHQVLITLLVKDETHFKVKNTVQIPGIGKQNFMNLMMQVATDLFIDQCRFDPQHDAKSEQELYNALLAWLSNYEEGKTIQLELKSGNSGFLVKLPWEHLTEVLDKHYKKIKEQISSLTASGKGYLILSEELSRLPGFLPTMTGHDYEIVPSNQVIESCLNYQKLIAAEQGNLMLVDKLAISDLGINDPTTLSEKLSSDGATHLLLGNEAIQLNRVVLRNSSKETMATETSLDINCSREGLPEQLGTIDRTAAGIFFNSPSNFAILNHRPITKGIHPLKLGDQIKFEKTGYEIRLIKVLNGGQ